MAMALVILWSNFANVTKSVTLLKQYYQDKQFIKYAYTNILAFQITCDCMKYCRANTTNLTFQITYGYMN
ncbi:hypothetical protein EUGRSUZ_I00933 [Eucalyptus grandis]|uniref:Uncharacterized protein n=2 Tax=Eucalyptus grandis TaxID=71139 RepID=A0ACC3JE10_EUCGR|nr:hypothetical protein EUGRSUZ_I00933 [Eucalyptus grandis]